MFPLRSSSLGNKHQSFPTSRSQLHTFLCVISMLHWSYCPLANIYLHYPYIICTSACDDMLCRRSIHDSRSDLFGLMPKVQYVRTFSIHSKYNVSTVHSIRCTFEFWSFLKSFSKSSTSTWHFSVQDMKGDPRQVHAQVGSVTPNYRFTSSLTTVQFLSLITFTPQRSSSFPRRPCHRQPSSRQPTTPLDWPQK